MDDDDEWPSHNIHNYPLSGQPPRRTMASLTIVNASTTSITTHVSTTYTTTRTIGYVSFLLYSCLLKKFTAGLPVLTTDNNEWKISGINTAIQPPTATTIVKTSSTSIASTLTCFDHLLIPPLHKNALPGAFFFLFFCVIFTKVFTATSRLPVRRLRRRQTGHSN